MTDNACNNCLHRQWEEGDREYAPPGYGHYYCELVPYPGGALPEDVAYGRKEPENCPLNKTHEAAAKE